MQGPDHPHVCRKLELLKDEGVKFEGSKVSLLVREAWMPASCGHVNQSSMADGRHVRMAADCCSKHLCASQCMPATRYTCLESCLLLHCTALQPECAKRATSVCLCIRMHPQAMAASRGALLCAAVLPDRA